MIKTSCLFGSPLHLHYTAPIKCTQVKSKWCIIRYGVTSSTRLLKSLICSRVVICIGSKMYTILLECSEGVKNEPSKKYYQYRLEAKIQLLLLFFFFQNLYVYFNAGMSFLLYFGCWYINEFIYVCVIVYVEPKRSAHSLIIIYIRCTENSLILGKLSTDYRVVVLYFECPW